MVAPRRYSAQLGFSLEVIRFMTLTNACEQKTMTHGSHDGTAAESGLRMMDKDMQRMKNYVQQESNELDRSLTSPTCLPPFHERLLAITLRCPGRTRQSGHFGLYLGAGCPTLDDMRLSSWVCYVQNFTLFKKMPSVKSQSVECISSPSCDCFWRGELVFFVRINASSPRGDLRRRHKAATAVPRFHHGCSGRFLWPLSMFTDCIRLAITRRKLGCGGS